MKKFIFILILCLFFINLASATQSVTDPTIIVTNWNSNIGEFYIQNAITSNVTFSLKNAIVNNYYYLKYENGTDIVHALATSQMLNLTASNLPDGKYYITNSNPTILITNNSEYNKTITLTNVSAHTLTFALNDVNIGNYYYFRYANNTAITYEFAETSSLNLTVSNLPDGTYYITNSNPRLLITNYNATNKILNVSNMSDHIVTLNLTNVTNGRKYTLYNNVNAYITSGYAQDGFAILVARNLYDGIYHINTEIVGDTILVNKDNLLTKQLNVSYIPGYNGQLIHLAYDVNESYVFIDMKSTSSLSNITSNATHLIITDVVSDASETTYYNVTAIRKSTITTDAIYITTTIVIGGVLVYTFRKRRPGR